MFGTIPGIAGAVPGIWPVKANQTNKPLVSAYSGAAIKKTKKKFTLRSLYIILLGTLVC